MKHFQHFALTMLVALVSNISAFAYDFEVDGVYYNTVSLEDLTCEITFVKSDNGFYNSPYSDNFVIPSSVSHDGKLFNIVRVGDYAFRDCVNISSVIIPSSVTSIGKNAFAYCTCMSSVVIPSSVTSIDDYAFFCCESLTSIVIPSSVTSIGDDAFYRCESLTSIVIPNSITKISLGMFRSCENLTSVVIPTSVTEICASAFNGCLALPSIVIPKSVTSIGDNAFKLCLSLKEITSLNTTPPSIDDNTFKNVSKTECVVKVPDEAVNAYKAADCWKDFSNIEGLSGDETPETKKCMEPVIKLVDGGIVATSATENSTCYTTITSEDFKGADTNEIINLSGVYNISSYAHAEGYENSETVTALLVWVNPTLQETTNILSMEAKKAVVIKNNGDNVEICGTEQGEHIQLYSLSGMLLDSVTATDGETIIPYSLQPGQIYIIKYGNKSVKYKY